MSGQTRKAIIRGIPHIPSVVEVNVRSGPNTAYELVFKVPIGVEVMDVTEVRIDDKNSGLNGKTYQWFSVVFQDNRRGWVRDDLLNLVGDFTGFGYGSYTEPTFAFDQTRKAQTTPASPAPATPTKRTPTITTPSPEQPIPTQPTPTPQSMGDDLERVRRAAFSITETFEGHGYAAYQNYDAGVISYGRFQFTLAAGTLATVVTRYLERSTSQIAMELRNFQPLLVARDQSLRQHTRLKELLIAAANEPQMKQVQNDLATENYWKRMLELSAKPRGIGAPLSLALLFDIAINFGVMHSLLTMAETELGVAPRSRVIENGVTEQQLITKVAELRKRGHDRQAERDNLPGLRVRGDFWVGLVASGDWGLQGGVNGTIQVKGKPIQVRNPAEF